MRRNCTQIERTALCASDLVEFVKSCDISEPDLCGNNACLGGSAFQQQRFNIRKRGLFGILWSCTAHESMDRFKCSDDTLLKMRQGSLKM